MRLVVQYFVLIIFAFMALLTVLYLGERLTAPPAIGGEWRMVDPLPGGCAMYDGWNDPTVLVISQSGQYLELRLGGPNGINQPGRLIGERVSADRLAVLDLRLDRQATPQILEGTLRLPGCDRTSPARYERQADQVNSTRGAQ